MIREPKIEHHAGKPYLAIRTIAPFSGMSAAVNKLLKELRTWVKRHGLTDAGPFFLRYHVIDMNGPMDIEVGIMTPTPLPGDERVKPDVLPAGRYATLIYTGSGLKSNKALLDWAKANGIALERWHDPAGDAFRCRYEAYLTDYRVEPRKTRWEIELAIKIADE